MISHNEIKDLVVGLSTVPGQASRFIRIPRPRTSLFGGKKTLPKLCTSFFHLPHLVTSRLIATHPINLKWWISSQHTKEEIRTILGPS
jgi:hypothetical protein